MKNLSGSWKHKPPIFYVVIVFCLGVMLITVIRNILPWSNWVMDVAFGVFVLVCIAVCMYIFRDWHTDGKERAISFEDDRLARLSQPPPLQSLGTTKVREENRIAPVSQRQTLPVGNRNKSRNMRLRNRNTPVLGNAPAPKNVPVPVPVTRNSWEQGYRPPTTAVGNAVPVPASGIIFGQPFQVRTKVFGKEEQEHIVSLAKSGTSNRDICKSVGIGNGFYDTIADILKAYSEQVELLPQKQ